MEQRLTLQEKIKKYDDADDDDDECCCCVW